MEGQATLKTRWAGAPIEGECPEGMVPYAQKTLGNVWQAENQVAGDLLEGGNLYVDEIDWGDSLESVDRKVGSPVRVELSLYKTGLADPMTGYTMVMLASPSSSSEMQGVCAPDPDTDPSSIASYESTEATVYSSTGRLVIQKISGAAEPTWDAATHTWVGDGVDSPVKNLTFAGELNVGGKTIYGLSKGGWKPTSAGTYRITFFFPADQAQQTWFDAATIIRASEEEAESAEESDKEHGGGDAFVQWEDNLTYVDIDVASAHSKGGGGKSGR